MHSSLDETEFLIPLFNWYYSVIVFLSSFIKFWNNKYVCIYNQNATKQNVNKLREATD